MSNKFEQLLDYLVNEEMDKANELFHEIVVEKSREIYENLIAEEAEEDEEEMDEAASCDDEEEMDESAEEELEDSYMVDADDSEGDDEFGGDATDDMLGDVEAGDDEGGDDFGGEEGGESDAIFDIKNAIADLEAAFAELEASHGAEGDDEFGGDEFGDEEDGEEFGDEEDGEEFGDEEETDEMMGMYEGRRVTREYVEKVGNDWEKNSQKTQGQIVGANSGEKMPGSDEGRSPISSGKGKPTTGASASNILGKSSNTAEDGTKPHGKVGGLVKQGGKFTNGGTHNVDNVKSGIKTLNKQGSGYPNNNKTPSPVGAGTGDKAGQTSIAPETKKQFLPPHTK